MNRPEAQELFKSLQAALPTLEDLLENCNEQWGYEDGIYRFYHQSFKVFWLQTTREQIVEKLQALAPGRELNKSFMQLIHEGTGKTFAPEDNEKLLAVTRRILEAFFHAHFFLKASNRIEIISNQDFGNAPTAALTS
jgi:hypothetical protein